MKLTVFGATGGTGEQVVRQALAAGHRVTAVARRPEAVTITHPQLTVIGGDVLDPAWSADELDGAGAVVSALGSRAMGMPTRVYSDGTAAVIAAMSRHGVARLVAVSAAPVGPDAHQSVLERWVVYPLLRRFFGAGYDDMGRMERLLADSQVDWTVFRPPRLTNGPKTGRYRTAVDARLPHAWSLSRADLADAMLGAIDNTTLSRRAVAVAR